MSITGILTALVTPFHADGSIDDAGIQRHVDRQVEAGIHGLVPLGTTGEFTTMTHEERKHVTEAVIQAQHAGREALSDAELLQSKRVDTHDAASLDSLIERIRHYLPGL